MSLSNYASKALLNSLFSKTSAFGALGSAPSMYFAVSSTNPDTDGVTEPSADAGYARTLTSADDWKTATDADPSVMTNANKITLPEATGEWAEFGFFALMDAETGGNIILSGQLVGPNSGDPVTKTLTDGDTFGAKPGTLQALMS